MGMYTGIQIDVLLKPDVTSGVVAMLRHMTLQEKDDEAVFLDAPDHPLFRSDRWSAVLCCQSAYFPECEKEQPPVAERLAPIANNQMRLNASASLKNYGGEIAHFLDWLAPHVDPRLTEEVGWYRYEETRNRTYFKFVDGKVVERTEKLHIEDWENDSGWW